MECSACGREIDKDSFPSNIVYCPYCGDELHNENAMQYCPYCGDKLLIQANFCPHCGGKLLIPGKTGAKQKPERTVNKEFIEQKAKPVIDTLKENFGPERKMRKLYKQWVEFSNLPPEEIPEINKDIQSAKEPKEKEVSGDDYRNFIQ